MPRGNGLHQCLLTKERRSQDQTKEEHQVGLVGSGSVMSMRTLIAQGGPDEGRPQTKRRNLCCPKSDVRSGPKHGNASGDLPTMAVESQGTADGASGSGRPRENQSVASLAHRLERIELLNDHRDRLLLQCAPVKTTSRRVSLPNVTGRSIGTARVPFLKTSLSLGRPGRDRWHRVMWS